MVLHHQLTMKAQLSVLLAHHDCTTIFTEDAVSSYHARLSVSDDARSTNKVSWPLTNLCFALLLCIATIKNLQLKHV